MSLGAFLAAQAATALAAMVLVWVLSLRLDDTSIVDVAWGLVFALLALSGALLGGGWPTRRYLVAGLVVVWGLRLATHIAVRNRGRGEDPRYAAWREEHGAAWPLRSLFTVFLLQGAILWVVALPVQIAQWAPAPALVTPWDVVGVLLWTFGFLFESVADAQLLAFKRRPGNRGRLLTSGLWRYSRHPNYFGESVLWWGLGLIACSVPWGWATLVGPALLTWLLLRVSGVPMTDELMADRPGFAEYVRRTSAFVPRPPRGE